MHEVSITYGIALVNAPDTVEWRTIPVDKSKKEFIEIYNILLNASSRSLYFLLQTYDAKLGWVNSANGNNITGTLLSASYSYSNSSNLTRTFDFSFFADGKENLFISPTNICKFFIGVSTNLDTNIIYYFSLGCGMIDSPSWSYDAESRNVSFNAIDLACILDGTRTGTLSYQYIWSFEQDSTVRDNIIGIIENTIRNELGYMVEYTETSISSCTDTSGTTVDVQNDIEASSGDTVMNMLNKIIENTMPYYCYYFDSNGLFNYSIIPQADPKRYVQYDIPNELVMSEQTSRSYSGRANTIEVWGITQDTSNMDIDSIRGDGFSGQLKCDGTTYTHPTYETVIPTGKSNQGNSTYIKCYCEYLPAALDDLLYTGDESWGCNVIDLWDCKENIYIKINNTDRWWKLSGEYYTNDYNVVYINRKGTSGSYSYNLQGAGRVQVHGNATQKTGEFGTDKCGIIRSIISDETIPSDRLCTSRARWELYKATQLVEQISISIVPMYFIQAGQIVNYTSLRTGETDTYIIDNVNCQLSVNGTMNISMTKFYTYYEDE